MPIFTVLFVIIVVVSIVKVIQQSKSTGIKIIPTDSMGENSAKVLDSYIPQQINVNDLVRNMAALKLWGGNSKIPTSSQVSFEMYSLLSSVGGTKSILKCYALAKPKNLETQLTYRDASQNTLIKTSEGLIESDFDGVKMKISFKNQPMGSFDFENLKILNTTNAEIGTFTVPDAINLKTSLMFDVQAFTKESAYEFISEIFMNGKKAATLLLQPATFEVVDDVENRNPETDFPLFNEINTQSPEEIILIVGFAVSFLALLENTRSKRGDM